MARNLTKPVADRCQLVEMDASRLGFRDNIFDIVVCIQNGISAFKVDQRQLIAEAVRVTRPGGKVLFSSYSDKFWEHRLEWFELQAQHGLLGEIDYAATGDGVIVCKDGFRATTVNLGQFRCLCAPIFNYIDVIETDNSFICCIIHKSAKS